jgi:hypothetical protein
MSIRPIFSEGGDYAQMRIRHSNLAKKEHARYAAENPEHTAMLRGMLLEDFCDRTAIAMVNMVADNIFLIGTDRLQAVMSTEIEQFILEWQAANK